MSSLVTQLVEGPRAAAKAAPASSLQDVIRSVRAGVPIVRAERVLQALDLSLDEAARSVGLKLRTIQRRKAEGARLDPVESEKVLRLARVADATIAVLGDLALAAEWLRSPNVALGGEAPLSLLDTDVGAAAVLDALTRLEHGVFS